MVPDIAQTKTGRKVEAPSILPGDLENASAIERTSIASSVSSAKSSTDGRRRSKMERFNDNVHRKISQIFSNVDWDQVNHYMDRLN